MRVEREVVLAAAPGAVWEVVMDAHRLEEWVAIHAWVRDAPTGTLEAGASFRQGLRLAGLPFEVRWAVVRSDRPTAAAWEGVGPGGSRAGVTYGLSPAGPGTRFSYGLELALPGGPLGVVAAPVVGAEAGRQADETLRRLGALVAGAKAG
jgi:hypothetical protein